MKKKKRERTLPRRISREMSRTRLSVTMPRALLRQVRRLAKHEETSVAVIVRKAVEIYISAGIRTDEPIEAEFEETEDANTDAGEDAPEKREREDAAMEMSGETETEARAREEE